jgi:hypothetical protein
MQILHKIAASIYCDLVVLMGLKNPPPRWMFNIPSKILPYQETHQILADVSFTSRERWLIEEAARNIEWFSNGLIRLDIIFQWDPTWIIENDLTVILRAPTTEQSIVEADGYFKTNILGLCSWMNNHSTIIHLVHDRLPDDYSFRTTAMHEIGHYLGMKHTNRHSVMHKHNYTKVLYMTRKDAIEFASIYKVDPDDLCYLKL